MEQDNVPACIGVIMDGNRRWAKDRSLETVEGHIAGRDTLMNLVEWAGHAGVTTLIVYTFSTENWKRSEEEVAALLELFRRSAKEQAKELEAKDIRVRFVGDLSHFPDDIQKSMQEIEQKTEANTKGTVAFAVSYGGRSELVHAFEQLKGRESVSEENIGQALWTHDLPDPDMIIRTGGQKRLSNFLPWQSVYSELFFTDTLWPDFGEEEFGAMLEEFAGRKRNFGK